MKEVDTILTIAIPTYNRAKKLKQTIERLVVLCKGKNIEIIISDNASTDETELVVKNIQEKNPHIRYYKNEENVGFDGNFLKCLENAKGEYVWLLGDDDYVIEGAIESILNSIKHNPVCIHLNSSSLIDEKEKRYRAPRYINMGDIIYTDKNDFLESIGIYCTFISSLVFNTNYVRMIKNKNKYFGTNILQSHIYLETMTNDGVYIINTYNCIAASNNKVVKYDVLKTWIKSFSDLLLITAVNCGFDKSRVSRLLEECLDTYIYRFVIRFRLTCQDESSWDRACAMKCINRYPRLVRKYKQVLFCSKFRLRILFFFDRMNVIVRKIMHQK